MATLKENGYEIFNEFIPLPLVGRLIIDIEKACNRCHKIREENGVSNSEGTSHHLIGQAESFMDCLAEYERIDSTLSEYFQGKYILNSFGGNILRKGMSYANAIHRDIRSFSGDLSLMLNTVVFLDDFTAENGATWLMQDGHKWPYKPSENTFKDFSFQITGKAGTVVVWNSNMWHRAGDNTTDKSRRSVTPEFTKPFIKQGYDYTQFVKDYTPEYLKQVLGWYSRTPSSLQEWYQKPDERFYRGDQG